jgi:hypothetical protein
VLYVIKSKKVLRDISSNIIVEKSSIHMRFKISYPSPSRLHSSPTESLVRHGYMEPTEEEETAKETEKK